MSTTTKKTKKTKGLNDAVKPEKKKKLSYYQKQKAINEIAQAINAGMTRRYLFDMLFNKQ